MNKPTDIGTQPPRVEHVDAQRSGVIHAGARHSIPALKPIEASVGEAHGQSVYSADKARKGYHERLHNVRMLMPFVDQIPFPYSTRTVKLNANTPINIVLPSGTSHIVFSSSNDFYAALGRADIPSTYVSASDQDLDQVGLSNCIVNPTGRVFYVEGINSIGLQTEFANTVVSIWCYQGNK